MQLFQGVQVRAAYLHESSVGDTTNSEYDALMFVCLMDTLPMLPNRGQFMCTPIFMRLMLGGTPYPRSSMTHMNSNLYLADVEGNFLT